MDTTGERLDALDLMLARRSIRRFTKQDVSLADEQKLLDAAFAAPSSHNVRPWHFVVVRDPHTRERLSRLHEWTGMLRDAPLVIGVLGDSEDHPRWVEDCSAAAENILLQAAGLGLGAVWCGIRQEGAAKAGCEAACREALGVPEGTWRVLALIGVGRPAERKKPRTQRQARKVSYERFGRRTR